MLALLNLIIKYFQPISVHIKFVKLKFTLKLVYRVGPWNQLYLTIFAKMNCHKIMQDFDALSEMLSEFSSGHIWAC